MCAWVCLFKCVCVVVCALSCGVVMCCVFCVWLLFNVFCGLCLVSRALLSGVRGVVMLRLLCVACVRVVLT